MKKIFYFLILSTLIFNSCKEDTVYGCTDYTALNYNANATIDDNSCEFCTGGTLRLTCISSNPYDVWIDGIFALTLNGGSFIEYTLVEGTHTVHVEQVSGYLLWPTIEDYNVYIYDCQDSEVVFPQSVDEEEVTEE